MSIGELLKELRGDEGLRDAAKRMNITFSYLAMLERGLDRRTGNSIKPTSETLQRIAEAYKCDYLKLVEVAGFSEDSSYNPALRELFAHNLSLQQWYKSLPHCNEKDVENLKIIWDIIHQGGAELKKAYTFDAKITFDEFSQDWLKLYRTKGNKETTNEHRAYCISLLNRYIAKKKMTAISTIELQGVLNHLFENGTAFNTLRGTHNAAKMIFAYAKETGLIEINPVEATFVPKKKMTLEEVTTEETSKLYLESDELKEFLRYVDKHRNIMYRTLIYTIAFTGMRPGEAVALKYEDVDLEKKVIHINKTVYAKKSIRGDFELTPPKTFGSIRSVDIVVEKLKQLYEWREDRE